jgi:hypothetical protein
MSASLESTPRRVPYGIFIDFVLREGKAKETIVKNAQPGKYDPRTDFYKRLRTQFERVHQAGSPITDIDVAAITEGLNEGSRAKKVKAFSAIIDGYAQWAKGKTLIWFKTQRQIVPIGDLELVVNPHFGLEIDGIPSLIRLHLSKSTKMDSQRAGLMTYLMRLAYPELPKTHKMTILDIRKGFLYEEIPPSHGVIDMLNREATKWVEIAQRQEALEPSI